MNLLLALIIFLLVIGLGAVIFGLFLLNKRLKDQKRDEQALLLLQNQLNEVTRVLDHKLGESALLMEKQISQSYRILQEVTEKLVRLDETNKQVINFATQLQDLQDILKNPKQRGILGEYYLETVLKNVLPPGTYQMQYRLDKDLIVDAVIFLKDKIIPIDSKFSLENYNRLLEEKDPQRKEELERQFRQDLKNRIDETAKYIQPQKGTMDFAFMFIPAEAVFYDLLMNKVGVVGTRDLLQYAIREKKVIIVSPTSFFAYLQTVLQGLRALQIEESAKEIVKKIGELARHLMNYETYMKKLGNSLATTVNNFNNAYKELAKIDKDVFKITDQNMGIEPLFLEQPKNNEEL